MSQSSAQVGIVAIGRNEGERLRRCLESLRSSAPGCPVVYVDSGSTDASRALAAGLDADVVELDLSTPFTAARARNAGIDRLLARHADLEFVQVIDGDCQLREDWLPAAIEAMRSPRVAVVCGRRREAEPDATIFNRLIDVEWNTPVGEAGACGGDALIRLSAFQQVGGYDPGIIAGEEPDMCLRMRRLGWRVMRIDHEMTLHDASMTHFSQWWKRAVRSGFAYADGALRHGLGPERYNLRPLLSILAWAMGIPLAGIAAAVVVGVLAGVLPALVVSACLTLLYLAQVARLATRARRNGLPARVARAWAASIVIAKFAEMVGVLTCVQRRLRRADPRLIEYKRPESSATAA